MKATLAMIACLAIAGFLTAEATVVGNNTAVVIQKDKVESKTGWQLLCVPVEGLAINGTANATIDISTILPPDSYEAGTSVWIDSSEAFELSEDANGVRSWTPARGRTESTLAPGQIFWIKKPAENSGTGSSGDASGITTSAASLLVEDTGTTSSITFCGQNHTRSEITRPAGGSTVLCANDSSEPLKISTIAPDGMKKGDQIFRIQHNKNNYQIYRRLSSVWKRGNDEVTNADVIAPGESFYYYSAK